MISLAFAGFMAGCAAVAAPLLLHLLRKKPTEHEPFPAFRFLKPTLARKKNKNNIRKWIVLIARCAAIIALSLAFSWPYIADFAKHPDSATVLLWDKSFSMDARGVATEAEAKAFDTINSANPKNPLLIGMVGNGRVQWNGGFSGNSGKLTAFFNAESKSEGASSFANAFKMAGARLDAISAPKKKIILITDKQALPWKDIDAKTILPPGVQLQVDLPNATRQRNVAIISAETAAPLLREKQKNALSAKIKNFSDESWNVKCSVSLDGKKISEKKILLKPGATAQPEWPLDIAKLEPHWGKIEINVPDSLTPDNTRFFALNPATPPKVLIIGKSRDKADFLALALATDPKAETAKIQTLEWRDAADKIDAASLIVIRKAPPPNSETGRKTLRAVAEKNALCVVLWNDSPETRAFLMELGVTAPFATEKRSLNFGTLDFKHNLFRCFENARVGNLFNVSFENPPKLKLPDNAILAATFSDGSPAVAEIKRGKGEFLIVATSLDRKHTDWQISPFFLPFWREVLDQADKKRRTASLRVGDNNNIPKNIATTERLDPDKGKWTKTSNADAARPNENGIFRLTLKSGQHILLPANLPSEESDPAPLNDDFDWRNLVSTKTARNSDVAAAAITPFSPEARNKAFWKILLAVALTAALLEMTLANRTAL